MVNSGDQNGTGRDGRKQVWTLFVWNLSNGLHWKGLCQCFDRHGVVVDAFIPVKRAFDGTRFGFVCMASRVDALRAIERLDGFMLYGSWVKVLFAARATRDSFWRRKKGSLPRPPDSPQGVVGAVTAAMGIAESRVVSPYRSVEGIVDDAKLAILQTCAIGWVKEAVPIRVLAQEMAAAGLQGFELVWVAGSMVLLYFSSMELRDGLLVSTEGSVYAVVIQEAELVRVSTVEDRDVEFESEMEEKSNEVRVASPQLNMPSKQVRVVSPCWHINQLWDSVGGGVVGGILDPWKWWQGVLPEIGLMGAVRVCVVLVMLRLQLARVSSPPSAVVGVAKAALAPVLGVVSGGIRKVKSVNCLVEALTSPEQRQVVAAACSRKGRGRLVKNRVLIEFGSDIVNASLTDSDIQESM
ncbi:hypothetical protein V6N11_028577 [Hibiscus sabdariffa]|uniref:RRM domain-containing protein n=1 Tax=Hibiscus sabdariffa TaxID=183260 RepID=A0ABR2N9Z3_9ROSI